MCAVSYLNTVPLVWGMLHGPQRDQFQLDFRTPAECADSLACGAADIGIVPVVEVARQRLEVVPGVGIACCGAVRSILLVSRVPASEIRTLAADSSSRTSVLLARVVIEDKFGASPAVLPMPPDLERMLEAADAALIIGDNALSVDLENLPYTVWDLGQEWLEITGLPMVFALWAGRPGCSSPAIAAAFTESWRYGVEHLEDIVREQAPLRGLPEFMVREYFARNVVFEIGPRELAGMKEFLNRAARFDILVATGKDSV